MTPEPIVELGVDAEALRQPQFAVFAGLAF
jgi:hypothetical protein